MIEQKERVIAILTIVKYRLWAIPLAILSMAIFRIPLLLNKKITFWRLMGCGLNGTFDRVPDLKQWAILTVHAEGEYAVFSGSQNVRDLHRMAYGAFIKSWLGLFGSTRISYLLQPVEGHGLWNGKKVFGTFQKKADWQGEVAILTRATIRLSKIGRFWQHVPAAAKEMASAEGFVKSFGIGEWPWIKQATFSIWESREKMQRFAYESPVHKDIIRKTRSEKWYAEDMFVRFRILQDFDENFKALP